jgi:hypothetical protein
MGDELRKDLAEYRSQVKKNTEVLLKDFGAELTGMREEWQRMVLRKPPKVVPPLEAVELPPVEEKILEDKILAVVKAHPHGISLPDIGKEMKIEWRKLIRSAKELLDKGKIKKVDVNYFPV